MSQVTMRCDVSEKYTQESKHLEKNKVKYFINFYIDYTIKWWYFEYIELTQMYY